MREIKDIVIHCSATTSTLDIGAKEIKNWHKMLGWKDIGYHFLIRRNGALENGRHIEKVGAHVSGHNQFSIGICLIGGADISGKSQNNFTKEQFITLKKHLVYLKSLFPKAQILGHRDYPNVKKNCPSFDVKLWLKENYA